MSESTHRPMTKSEYAVRVLREKIQSGELKPGDRLRVDAVANELGVSLTPIREALRLLQAEGFVEYRAHQEIVVSHLPTSETLEIYELRLLLEPLATERAVPHLTEDELMQLESLHQELTVAVHEGRSKDVPRLNEAWHRTIYAACGSTHLIEFIRRLWDIFPWRGMWDNYDMDCSELAESDHSEIMDAIRKRNAKRAARLMHQHMVAGRALVLGYVERENAEQQVDQGSGNGSVVSAPR